MTFILFDIDGTLTATNAVDAQCYAAAFHRTFGFPLPTTDWDVYKYCTDTGIIQEVVGGQLCRPAQQSEIDRFERAFVEELQAAFARNRAAFKEVPGARAMLEWLGSRPDMRPAIASGGMCGSACYKLSRIGVDARQYPRGFANDAITREGIAQYVIGQCALGRCTADWVYVGDGPWDLRTSAAVGMRFIGVTGDGNAERLAALGATTLIEDYVDHHAFCEAIRTASVPKIKGEII